MSGTSRKTKHHARIASRSAHQLGNTRAQYGALFAMAAAEALIFAPFLHYVFNVIEAGTSVASAAVVTVVTHRGTRKRTIIPR